MIDPKVFSVAPGSAAAVFSAVLVKGARPMATPEEFLKNLLQYVSTRLGCLDQELKRLHRRLDGLETKVYQRLTALEQQAAAKPPRAPRGARGR
jgi:hypothetical protein